MDIEPNTNGTQVFTCLTIPDNNRSLIFSLLSSGLWSQMSCHWQDERAGIQYKSILNPPGTALYFNLSTKVSIQMHIYKDFFTLWCNLLGCSCTCWREILKSFNGDGLIVVISVLQVKIDWMQCLVLPVKQSKTQLAFRCSSDEMLWTGTFPCL